MHNLCFQYHLAYWSMLVNLECFIEGTRSRLGKLLSPKLGIVKIVLDAIISGRVSDCFIVPMSLGYDKIIETSRLAILHT